ETDLVTRARMLGEHAREYDQSDLDTLCKKLGQTSNTRFTLVAPDGTVLGDSNQQPAAMERHENRPEIQVALKGGTGNDTRHSQTLGKEMMYVAVPLKDGRGNVVYAVRASLPMTVIDETLKTMTIKIVIAALLTGGLAMLICIFAAKRITAPLESINDAARHFARHDFKHRIPSQPNRELDQLAESLNEMAEQLSYLETVRSDFVANVSHELKTPITSIKGFVETLLSGDWNHDPDVLRFLEIINQQSGRLNAIIDDLLTLSRLEQKEGLVLKEPCGLASVLDNAITLCQLHAEKKNIAIAMDCPEELTLTINAPLIEQALVNLIINAVKYSEPDKTVQILAKKQAGQVMIQVKDEGFGIEEKHLHRLFERFYRVDTARSRKLGGTGLGLSIVNHIVQAHHGTIRVESTLGSGSTFTIVLTVA
ncbi:MAG: HAMP domain-containing protein, partial [Verrucomicrobia bacterium]|nr:HAMP domain-containing protein [Verrucomicrobiota bacterium]